MLRVFVGLVLLWNFGTAAIAEEPKPGGVINAVIQPEPPGLEAYSYVYKIKIKSGFGIPYGELAALSYVVGDRAECERQSAAHNLRTDGRVNEGNLRLSADPNERCARSGLDSRCSDSGIGVVALAARESRGRLERKT